MAGATADAKVLLSVEDRKLGPELKKAEASIDNFAVSTRRILTGISVAYLTKQFFDMGAAALAAYSQQIDVEKRLNAVLDSTSRAAGRTSEELVGLASELQTLTNVADDTIIAAETVLLTFTNIKGDVFDDAIRAGLNMSAVLGTDAVSAATMLGKALNDPTKGITALSRAGVVFSEQQKKLIEVLQESGRMEQAQRVILDELQTEYGNAANAGTSFSDTMKGMGTRIGEVQETVGGMITAGLVPFVPIMGETVASIEAVMAPAMGATLALAELANGFLATGSAAGGAAMSQDQFANSVSVWATGFTSSFGDAEGVTLSLKSSVFELLGALDYISFGALSATLPNAGDSDDPIGDMIRDTRAQIDARAEAIEQGKIDERAAEKANKEQAIANQERDFAERAEKRREQAVIEAGIVDEATLNEIGLKDAEQRTKDKILADAQATKDKWASAARNTQQKIDADEKTATKKAADEKLAIKKAEETEKRSLKHAEEEAERAHNERKTADAKATQEAEASIGRDSLTSLHDRIQDAALQRREEAADKAKANTMGGATADPNANVWELTKAEEEKTANALADVAAREAKRIANKPKPKFRHEDSEQGLADEYGVNPMQSSALGINPMAAANNQQAQFADEYGAKPRRGGPTSALGNSSPEITVETNQDAVIAAIDRQTAIMQEQNNTVRQRRYQ